MRSVINITHPLPFVRLKTRNKDVNNIKFKMKSTKIEDIIETVDEDITDDVNESVRNDDMVNNELKTQLDDLQNELSHMKQNDSATAPSVKASAAKGASVEPFKDMSTSKSLTDRLMTFNNNDFKNALIMMILFIVLNSAQVNDMIDTYMPYSIYSYGYIVKAILYFVSYRVIIALIIT